MKDASREALIKRLRTETWSGFQSMAKQAANMLEADAREISATERQVEILSDELSKCGKAQQVAVPPGYALAMAVLQSSLYQFLDDVERSECDALIAAAQGAKP